MVVVGNVVPDTTSPYVALLSPLASSTLSDLVTISASSSDSVGVTGVLFFIDGVQFGSEITTEPYQATWNTASSTNGTHSIMVSSHDLAGNVATSSVQVVVSNSTTTPPVNLVSNPSLETYGSDGMPIDWLKSSWGTNDATFSYTATSSEGASSGDVTITNYTSGDAKWYFKDILITPLDAYTYSEFYTSNVDTVLTVRYTMTNGSFVYVDIPQPAPASPTWVAYSATITPPLGAVSLTVFHKLAAVGFLGIDSISLIKNNQGPVDPGLFAQGMVSLTLDDGWLSTYSNAVPILNAAGLKGTFGIISQETAQAFPDNRIANPSLETVDTTGTPVDWYVSSWGTNNATSTFPVPGYDGVNAAKVQITEYTDGDAKWYFKDGTVIPNQDYTYSSYYMSDATTTLTVKYTYNDTSVAMVDLDTVGPQVAWTHYLKTIHIPANVYSLTVYHRLTGVGSLAIDNVELKRVQMYVDPTQVIALQNAGHEIAAHTQTHVALASVATSTMIQEINGSRSDLLGMGATPVDTLVYPYGDYNDAVIAEAKNAGFIGARSVDRGYNTKTTDKYALKIQQVGSSTTPGEIKAWIDTALTQKTWLILMYHQVDTSGLDLAQTPSDFQTTVDYLLAKNAWVVTLKKGITLMNP
jgi:peptidoglycan/xylan/chitin deacetylase (PgdA/CDA1 family)